MKKANESIEKKDLKDVVMEHKYQIFTFISCTSTCLLGYLLFKQTKNNKILRAENIELLRENKVVNEFKKTVDVIQEAMSEGMIQEAISTTTRKLNTRYDKRDRLLSKNGLNFKDKNILQKTLEEINVFERRLHAFEDLEHKYFIE